MMAGSGRPGANLYTSAIVAINADTGKMSWYFQASPHDTHGWGAVETPIIFDADFKGRPRKLLAQANRNGYLFVLDRSTGENLLSAPFVAVNWSAGIDSKGQPVPREDQEPKPDGVLVSPSGFGATSWLPSYDPGTKLLYVTTRVGSYAMFYRTSLAATPRGWAGVGRPVGRATSVLSAIDCQTGKIRWSSEAGGLGGVLSTAGRTQIAPTSHRFRTDRLQSERCRDALHDAAPRGAGIYDGAQPNRFGNRSPLALQYFPKGFRYGKFNVDDWATVGKARILAANSTAHGRLISRQRKARRTRRTTQSSPLDASGMEYCQTPDTPS